MARAVNIMSVVFVAFALAACDVGGPLPDQRPHPVVAEIDVLQPGPWRGFPDDQSARVQGDTITIPSGGGAMRVANLPAPTAGDVVSAHLRLTAQSETPVRIALVRHCNTELGEEGDSREITLSPAETDITLTHTLSQPYACVRVHIVSMGQPAVVTVSELEITKRHVNR